MLNPTWIFGAYLLTAIVWGNITLSVRVQSPIIDKNNDLDRSYSQELLTSLNPHEVTTVYPVAETEDEISLDDNDLTIQPSDADDPAIYINSQDPSQSLVIATFKKGGLGVYDLEGEQIQKVSPKNIRYNNVDIAYGVEYQSQMVGETATVDLAIASDRANDTLAIFRINPNDSLKSGLGLKKTFPLEKISSTSIPDSIFGVDDGNATAYGLTTYTSSVDNKTYVFVSQSDGNNIAQLEIHPSLGAADELTVNARVVRTFKIPIPQGMAVKDAFVEGMVVDKETEILYLAQESFGIWQVDLNSIEESLNQPNNTIDLINKIKPESPLSADIEGLTIYYGDRGTKYLIASSQGDSTFAVYDLANRQSNDDSYVGSFRVEGVRQTDGLDITNVPLGKEYPAGLLVVQDGVNKVPQQKSDLSNDNIQYLRTNFKFVSAKDIFTPNMD